MYKVCKEGRRDIIDLMIKYGETSFNEGLRGAYEGGHIEIVNLMLSLGADNYQFLKYGNLELRILYIRLTSKDPNNIIITIPEITELPIKTQHPEYHLLNVYQRKIPDIYRLINKYLY